MCWIISTFTNTSFRVYGLTSPVSAQHRMLCMCLDQALHRYILHCVHHLRLTTSMCWIISTFTNTSFRVTELTHITCKSNIEQSHVLDQALHRYDSKLNHHLLVPQVCVDYLRLHSPVRCVRLRQQVARIPVSSTCMLCMCLDQALHRYIL